MGASCRLAEHDSFYRRTPLLVVANMRSGGTYLCYSLDSHPDIGCLRAEPLHPESHWIKIFGEESQDNIVRALWGRTGFNINGFKVTYPQYDILEALPSMGRAEMCIHLVRNVIDSTLSQAISMMRNDDPLYSWHTHTSVALHPVEINPAWFVKECRAEIANIQQMRERLSARFDSKLLEVRYSDIVPMAHTDGWMPHAASKRICSFLSVQKWPLYSSTRPVNQHYGHARLVTNWPDVEQAIRKANLDREIAYLERPTI